MLPAEDFDDDGGTPAWRARQDLREAVEQHETNKRLARFVMRPVLIALALFLIALALFLGVALFTALSGTT